MASKFEIFAALHAPRDAVILYNIWNVGSALADAHGWPDGQLVPSIM
jgi:2-methylisocitrate lyase-like PEP mutase family enzyme